MADNPVRKRIKDHFLDQPLDWPRAKFRTEAVLGEMLPGRQLDIEFDVLQGKARFEHLELNIHDRLDIDAMVPTTGQTVELSGGTAQ